ncbi:MAG: AAA family ATPase [Oscillospiraceae bacterium]|jgi:stage III sporulation protein AA|nr:AAA family ATPase [Oscillospiraceae bacterium]
MDSLYHAAALFPPDIFQTLKTLPVGFQEKIEELRVTRDKPLSVKTNEGERLLCQNRPITARDIDHIVLSATGGSYHSAAETIKQGYITVKGGSRIGLCGEGAMRGGQNETLRYISSLCIRIPRPALGCADTIFPTLCADQFLNTLIISPPGMGKTTLLRELVRKLSASGYRVSLADERGELASMYQGVPQFDLGPRTDVISNVTKCQAAIMMIRSMAPDILAMDEITATADLPAILEAAGCGVSLLATVHGSGASDLKQKKMFRELFSYDIFQKAVCIELQRGRRVYTVMDL